MSAATDSGGSNAPLVPQKRKFTFDFRSGGGSAESSAMLAEKRWAAIDFGTKMLKLRCFVPR